MNILQNEAVSGCTAREGGETKREGYGKELLAMEESIMGSGLFLFLLGGYSIQDIYKMYFLIS